jgi:hypothetical protein
MSNINGMDKRSGIRPPEWCENISKAKKAKNRKLSPEHLEAIRAATVGRRAPECKYGHDMTQIGARNKSGQCVECLHVYRRTYHVEWKKANRDQIIARIRMKRYGLSEFAYAEMLLKQNGVCALCGGLPKGKKRDLEVDHDHETGKVRALLCCACNVLLGRVEKSPQLIENMVAYLKEHRVNSMVTN